MNKKYLTAGLLLLAGCLGVDRRPAERRGEDDVLVRDPYPLGLIK